MRALILTVLIAALVAGGYFIYRTMSPAAPDGSLFAPAPAPAPLPTAEDCTARDAVYEYNDDRRLVLRFRQLPTEDTAEITLDGRQNGNMAFVVRITSFGRDYVFQPVDGSAFSGPRYETAAVYVRPETGGERIQVSMFDSEMHYLAQPLRDDSVAPAYVYMPAIMPILYQGRVDLAPGVFRFQSCETPAPRAAP